MAEKNPLTEDTLPDDSLLSEAESSLKEVREAQDAIEKKLKELRELENEYL